MPKGSKKAAAKAERTASKDARTKAGKGSKASKAGKGTSAAAARSELEARLIEARATETKRRRRLDEATGQVRALEASLAALEQVPEGSMTPIEPGDRPEDDAVEGAAAHGQDAAEASGAPPDATGDDGDAEGARIAGPA